MLQPLPGAPTTSLSSLLQTLDSFPGPLGSNSKSDKVREHSWPAAIIAFPGQAYRVVHASWPLHCVPPALCPPAAFLSLALGVTNSKTHSSRCWPASLLLYPQVAAFCGEQADAAGADPAADYASSEGRRTLWCVLRVLAAHQGRASSAPYSLLPAAGSGSGKPADPAAAPEAQLVAALLEGVPPVSEPQLLLPAAAPPPKAAAAVAAQVQQLLLEGRRSEALK